uniref:Ycf1 n=1 Tax=Boodleopsis pusilla TaxID=381415 RepID=A0A386AZC6_9CHLO|nr:hypothetical protein Ycf1 [Boodleopsis pusilla]AYC64798.1 hypothetical protein Ycf1 [Boodleopsis pusilla]
MSLIPLTETIKNTIEVLNQIYEMPRSDGQLVTFFKFLSQTSFYWFSYFVRLEWIYDFVKLPILLPEMAESIFSEMPHSHLSFLPMEPSDNSLGTSFVIGFFNCFFLYFPLSPVHWIWLRYVLLDGQKVAWAGWAATLGLIAGNLSLFGCCLFGCRPIMNIWFGLEPFSYFFGVWLVLKVIFDMVHSPSLIKSRYPKSQLWKIFFIHCGCVWADQSGFYQFFGNLSVQSGFSLLDVVPSSSILYFMGVFLGSFFWTFIISQTLIQVGYFFPIITKYTYSSWIRGVHYFCVIGSIALTLTSFGFYGADYLLMKPLGFLPQDQALELVTLSAQTKDTSQGRLGEKSNFGSVDTDLSTFDRARYAGGPLVEFHIESLNFQEEYAWRSRIDRFSSRGLNRGGGLLDKYITTQLGPMDQALQKQRKYRKRAQQIQRLKQKKEKIQVPPPIETPISSTSDSDDIDSMDNVYEIPSADLEENWVESYQQLIERYIEDYTAEANSEDSEIPDLGEDKMIRFSAFSELAKYGFDSFSIIDTVELDPFDEELTRDLKEKFSENIINKFLIRFDMSQFLNRQPQSHQLTSQEEISLFKKRLALSYYFDTLRSSFQVPDKFQPLFCGPKSYANRVYNQQFKGTLKIVERLFSIHLEDEENIPSLPIPKPEASSQNKESDVQKNQKKIVNFKVEENEFTRQANRLENEYLRLKKEQKEKSVLKFDQPLYKTQFIKQNPFVHEQFMDQMPSLIHEADVQPFLEEESSYPFFVGWDNEQRKFVVTNRLLTRENILSKITIPKKIKYRKLSSTTQTNTNSNPTFTFTTWPVAEKALKNQPAFSRFFSTYEEMVNSAEDLFKYAEPGMEEDTIIYKKLPYIVRRIGFELKDQPYLAPKMGGFIWPGNEPLKYKFQFNVFIKNLLKKLG